MSWLSFSIVILVSFLLITIFLFFFYTKKAKLFNSSVSFNQQESALPKLKGSRNSSDTYPEKRERNTLEISVQSPMKIGKTHHTIAVASKKELIEVKEENNNTIEIPPSEIISCSLIGEHFEIQPFTDIKSQPLFAKELTYWEWHVKPQKIGHQKILINIGYQVKVGNTNYTKSLKAIEKEVYVNMNPPHHVKQFFITNWQWLLGSIVGSGIIWQLIKLKLST
ncbi:hypothetical protein [Pseudoflavitalea rhizosphaerae]|uniref:hypothetical protein n=1 Tax=Pseudoflavitalea rhizosphaerae TaxID=1884793 RepID=UPI000F8F7095|nr:hypothetical protein [Pseudoflavitalea rhizosphaerae]